MNLLKTLQSIASHFLIISAIITSTSIMSKAQVLTPDELRAKAYELVQTNEIIDALPFLEKLVKAVPNDSNANFYYGFALIAKAKTFSDQKAISAARVKARKALVNAKELGAKQEVLDDAIDSIKPGGGFYSENAQVETFMSDGNAANKKGNYDEAINFYKKALEIEPKLIQAALFIGTMFSQKNDLKTAEIWFQKAITIDPNNEKSYRYSAVGLMNQNMYEKAKDRYIEAYIVEPYNGQTTAGLSQWAKITKTQLGHPQITRPKYVIDENGQARSSSRISMNNDGSVAWVAYTLTREKWFEGKFAEAYPNEKTYRHSLKEEVDALKTVIKTAKETKKKDTKFNKEILTLMELDKKGLLEAYILLGIPDQGITRDHTNYLKANRDKLRQYVLEYVIQKTEKQSSEQK